MSMDNGMGHFWSGVVLEVTQTGQNAAGSRAGRLLWYQVNRVWPSVQGSGKTLGEMCGFRGCGEEEA